MISAPDETTAYRSPLLAVAFRATGVFIGVSMIAFLLLVPLDAVAGLKVALGIAFSLWSVFRLSRCCVYADRDGIRVINPLSSTRLHWDEVRRFVLVDLGACRVERVDGPAVKLFGIQQPALGALRRHSGERAMVDELNRRLGERRAAGG